MTDKKSFVMYTSWMPMICSLPDETVAQLMKAVAAYQLGTEYEITNEAAYGIFQMFKGTFDEDREKYDETCRRRSESGKHGGRPPVKKANAFSEKQNKPNGFSEKAKKANAFSEKQNKAKSPDNEYEYEYDNDSDKELLKDYCTEPSSEAPAPADCEPIPLNDGTEWRPTAEEFAEYVRLYPAVDVRQQFAAMRGWSIGNPTRKKTRSGVKRFVSNWLSKEQNSGKRQDQARAPTTNKFTDFEQRDYDWADLENRLLRV